MNRCRRNAARKRRRLNARLAAVGRAWNESIVRSWARWECGRDKYTLIMRRA